MQDYYAARAPEYDAVYLKPERQADLRAIEAWLPLLFEGRSTLEIACGTGYWTRFIAPVAARVLAVDTSAETLSIAVNRVPSSGVEFVVADAYELPQSFRDFQAAFAGFWFSHVPHSRLQSFLQGLHAALSPGAKVVLLDNRFVATSSTPISDRDDEGNTYQVRRLRDGSTYRVIKNFPSESELREAVAAAAVDVRFHAWEYFWALEYTVR